MSDPVAEALLVRGALLSEAGRVREALLDLERAPELARNQTERLAFPRRMAALPDC